MNISNTHTFIVNGRKVKTVNELLRQAGMCLLQGKDLIILSQAISGESWSKNSTIVSNWSGRTMTENQLCLVCHILTGEDINDD
jgi:hypothetical protein